MENDREQEAKGEDVKKSESKDPPNRPEPIVFVGKMVSCIYERARYKVNVSLNQDVCYAKLFIAAV